MNEITGYKKHKAYAAVVALAVVCACFIISIQEFILASAGVFYHFFFLSTSITLFFLFLVYKIQKSIKSHTDVTKGLLHSITDVILIKDYQGNFVFCNEAVAKLYNTTPEEMVGKDDYHFTKNKEQSDFFRENVQHVIRKFEKEEVFESSTDANTGEIRHFHSVKIPYRDVKDQLKVLVFAKDITGITLLKEESEKNKKRLEHVLDVSEEGLWEWNILTNEVVHNHQWELLTGIESTDNTFAEFENAILPEDRPKVFAALEALQTKNQAYSIEFRMKRPDGAVIWIWDRGRVAEYDEDHNPLWLVGIAQDITQEKLNQKKITNLAYYDQLTGLTNRSQLEIELDKVIEQSKREDSYSALLTLDLDRFKLLNDSYGHHMGDKLLESVAQAMLQVNPEGSVAARFGGDEFVVVIPTLSTSHTQATLKAQQHADNILQKITQPLNLKSDLTGVEIEYLITASIGGIVFKSAEMGPGKLLQLADIAMYRAKNNGGNSVLIFDADMHHELEHYSSMQKALRDSIANRDFCVHLQPKYDIDQNISGAEALVRWQHPELGLLYPDSFINMAEESNGIIEIGAIVLEQVCLELEKWQSEPATRHLKIAVNLSAKQIWHNQFVEDIIKTISSHNIDPTALIFEVTESVLIQDINDAIDKLSRLKKYGVSISLDDFGTGYSSMNYLRSLPIDELKIDRSFINDITTDHASRLMVKSIIDLAGNFNLKVVSEGVETAEQFEMLKQYGVIHYQGYHFSKPIPVDAFNQLLDAKKQDEPITSDQPG